MCECGGSPLPSNVEEPLGRFWVRLKPRQKVALALPMAVLYLTLSILCMCGVLVVIAIAPILGIFVALEEAGKKT